ncbi:MAG: hypothetical protein EGR71_03380 [Clostridiales bacterium]|nr:hypothetical protein [Clostridiales bacterium]
MKWYNNLYVGKKALKKKHKIITRAIRRKPQIGIYMITLPVNEANALEIYPSYVLLQKYYRKKKLTVVGISQGYDEALEVMQDILMDCYNETGQFLVRHMVERHQ